MIPSSDIGEGCFDSGIRFNETRDLLKCVAEPALILCAIRGAVWIAVDGLDQLYRFKGFLSRREQTWIRGRRVHAFEDARNFLISRLELLQIVHSHCLSAAT